MVCDEFIIYYILVDLILYKNKTISHIAAF